MSSIMDKGKLPTKMFLRSNSFQKLCSLAHPMRLRGFKSNREALKSVFESLIVTTRGVIQSVTYRILCFLFLTPFTKLLRRPLQGLVDAVATAAAATTSANKDGRDDDGAATNSRLNTVRLILKLTLSMIVSTDKNSQLEDVHFDNELRLSEEDTSSTTTTSGTSSTTLQTPECPHRTPSPPKSVAEMAVQTDPEPEPEFFDCKEPPAERPPKAKVCQFLESSLLRRPPRRSPRTAAAAVYGCVLCCAVQLSALVYLLCGDAVRFPPGLIFLILALAYIGFIMTRIFTSSTDDIRTKLQAAKKKNNEQEDIRGGSTSKALVVATVPEGPIRTGGGGGGLHPVLAAVSKRILATLLQFQQPHEKTSRPTPRQSRSATRTRMLLCADDKTISKVKIL